MQTLLLAAVVMLSAFSSGIAAIPPAADAVDTACTVELLVLGIAQDAGIPQIGQRGDPAWAANGQLRPDQVRLATSLALIDKQNARRYLFEATPDIRQQLQRLDLHAPTGQAGLGIDGIFISHAHIGHYAGLMFLGRESAGAQGIPVYTMPRMRAFLQDNGPWQQLVQLKNIELRPIEGEAALPLTDVIRVTALQVPHRDEYSETVGFSIDGPARSVLFIPDIDSWERWQDEYGRNIDEAIKQHDLAFLDATFYDDNELPGRDMSAIPHPRIAAMMDRFDALPPEQRRKIRFIHLNHSNPARYASSDAGKTISMRGYQLAREGESYCLDAAGSPREAPEKQAAVLTGT